MTHLFATYPSFEDCPVGGIVEENLGHSEYGKLLVRADAHRDTAKDKGFVLVFQVVAERCNRLYWQRYR